MMTRTNDDTCTAHANVMRMGHAIHVEQSTRHTRNNLITRVDHAVISALAAREQCVAMRATNAKQRSRHARTMRTTRQWRANNLCVTRDNERPTTRGANTPARRRRTMRMGRRRRVDSVLTTAWDRLDSYRLWARCVDGARLPARRRLPLRRWKGNVPLGHF
jgi:hypothetical protein